MDMYNRHYVGDTSILPSIMTSTDSYDEITSGDLNSKYRTDDNKYFNALVSTAYTVALALIFGIFIFFWKGANSGMEFLAGYIVEQSLSVDNLFVFLMLFDYFKVPLAYQNRVLTWGIIGAIVMRGIMIYFGVAAIAHFEWIMLVFAIILLISAFKLMQGQEEEEDLSNNFIMKISAMIVPATNEYDGDRFFIREKGRLFATPLFMCLICIEFSDLIFAIDSIPAVIGISKDPLIVYSSNIFAIMGLRALYTVLSKAIADLPYLKPAVALVLGFVGEKMIGEYFSYNISTAISLMVVVVLIGGGVFISYCEKRNKDHLPT